MTTERRDPKSLRRHPLHKARIPSPDKDSAKWAGFLENIRNVGRVEVPLKITADGLVMEGWWRREGACDLQLKEVPCDIAPAEDAALIMVDAMTARKKIMPGTDVYIAVGLLPEYAEAANARRLRNKVAQRATTEEIIDAKVASTGQQEGSRRYLAQLWGCSKGTVDQAFDIRAVFHDLKTFTAWVQKLDAVYPKNGEAELQEALRAEFEPLLFNGKKSLWSVLQAIAGRLSTAEKARVVEQLDLFSHDFSSLISRAGALDDMKPAFRQIETCLARVEEIEHLQRLHQFFTRSVSAIEARITSTAKQSRN